MPATKHTSQPLPHCRLVDTRGKHWTTYPHEWKQRITRIAQIQERLQDAKALGSEWSDKQFTGTLATKNVWASMRLGQYPFPTKADTQSKWLRELEVLEQHASAHLSRIADSQARDARTLEGFVETLDYKAVKGAIEKARQRASTHNQDRAVAYIAKTGRGKTMMAYRLMEDKVVNYYVEATPCWKRSYRALLLSLASTWALTTTQKMSTLDLETIVIAHARSLSGVILFEEVDTLCSTSQEFLKLLLNRSTLVVCMFMTPEARDALKAQGGSQLAQLFRRFEAMIVAADLQPADIIPFQPELWSRATEAQLTNVAQIANAMGGVDAVKRIGSTVALYCDATGPVPGEALDKAITAYRSAVPIVTIRRHRNAA
ncbi:MAG: ATP-binding protein [Prosthecobacter sp.]